MLTWKLEAYDRAGNVIGTISRKPQGAIVFEGTSDAFALCLPDLRTAAAFFTDPNAIGRAAYEAYYEIPPGGDSPWDQLKAHQEGAEFVAKWIATGQAAIDAPTY